MATPSTLPTWATDANFTSGPKSGSPTKVVPSAGALAQGDVPGQPYRSERKNWLFYWICQWLAYLSNLNNETGFVNAAFTWGGIHVFDFPATFNSNTALNGTTTSAADIELSTPASRVKRISLADFQSVNIPGTTAEWIQQETGEWTCEGDNAMIRCSLRLPAGSIVTRVRAAYDAVNTDANVALVRMTSDLTIPFSTPTRSILWQTASGVGGPGDVLVDSGTLAHTAADTSDLCIEITSSQTPWGAGPTEKLFAVEVTYTQVHVGGRV